MAVAEGRPKSGTGAPFLRQFVCVQCGYGASRAMAPERCPMCSGSVWELASGRFRGGTVAGRGAS
jgi:rubrerythrin